MIRVVELILRFAKVIVFGYVLNFLGGSLRWLYGTIWRSIANKPKFTFREYLYGPDQPKDWFDEKGHSLSNILVAFAFLFAVIVALYKSNLLG